MRTLYIGETNRKDSEYYYTLDKSAFNLDIKNYKEGLPEKKSGIFYTSLSDFNNELELLHEVCLLFDNIIYNPPIDWKEHKFGININHRSVSVRTRTECFLLCLCGVTEVSGLENIADIKSFYPTVTRQTDSPNLWIAGCSFSSAVGVDDRERWGQIVAKQLDMPVNFLAEGASGNSYQVDKILSSDIRKGDIVIMQVTIPERNTIIYHETLCHITATSYESRPSLIESYPPDRLDEPMSYINQIEDFKRLKNICKKIGAKLMLWSQHLMPGVLLPHLTKQEQYFHFTNTKHSSSTKFFLDYGSDNMHPGPLQHQAYAKFVLEKLKVVQD